MSCEPQTVRTIAISPPDLDDVDPVPEHITDRGTAGHGKIQVGTDKEGAMQAAGTRGCVWEVAIGLTQLETS